MCCVVLFFKSMFYTPDSEPFIGVNYGQVADNLPPPEATAKLLRSTSIEKVRLYGADPAIIKALAGTGIGIVIGAANGDIPAMASDPNFAGNWVGSNVLPFYPASKIIVVTVGNEVVTLPDKGLAAQLLPAMQNVQNALNAASLGGKIKVSTVHSMAVLSQSEPPSGGAFGYGDILKPLLDFHSANGSPFMINPYPFFAYQSDPRPETLSFCLFQPNAGRVDSGTGIKYMNMFDAQVDAVHSALKGMGFKDVEIVVAETGWPYKGDPNEVGPSLDNAKAYNGNLINHLKSKVGTPLMPGKSVDTYIFALYDEDMKPGPGSERAFGLYKPDLSMIYDAGLSESKQQVYSLDWTPEKNRVVSASQDGRLIVWNALTSQKTHAIKLPCAWVMACAFSPSGLSVACGGLDSMCSIFNLNSQTDKDGNLPVSRMLSGHKGYVSSCQYVPDEDTHLITASGDHTCVLWDITTGLRTSVFGGEFQSGHTADVLSVSINGSNSRMFVSGSCDSTARLWDTRVASRAVRTFHGHEGDVNTVKFFPDGNRFGTGSDDGTCKLFDIRTGHQLQEYNQPNNDSEAQHVTSIAFSISGRLLFAAYTNGRCYVWDTLLAQVVLDLGSLQNSHNSRISCLGLSADGSALCTGSWDSNLKIWAFGGYRKVI
ncbi:Guanine nucleotide-binding protein subunit beta [Striga hermonthica]|uniref:glucan endo-1,3-beta-D-glucosidase n=1 Tax=Striga hermonthica TaxID=68872 RepID=A0A9N7MMD8_STRHE|nr:Guanine nucleotide-binding protein subunit beta [Striga hermonthica]